jgi:transposase-like protein
MKTSGRQKHRRTRQDIEVLLGRYHQSGMSIRVFAKAEGVVETSLYRWLRQERDRGPVPELVEVRPMVDTSTVFSVQTPHGYRIEVPIPFSERALRRLLGVLEA